MAKREFMPARSLWMQAPGIPPLRFWMRLLLGGWGRRWGKNQIFGNCTLWKRYSWERETDGTAARWEGMGGSCCWRSWRKNMNAALLGRHILPSWFIWSHSTHTHTPVGCFGCYKGLWCQNDPALSDSKEKILQDHCQLRNSEPSSKAVGWDFFLQICFCPYGGSGREGLSPAVSSQRGSGSFPWHAPTTHSHQCHLCTSQGCCQPVLPVHTQHWALLWNTHLGVARARARHHSSQPAQYKWCDPLQPEHSTAEAQEGGWEYMGRLGENQEQRQLSSPLLPRVKAKWVKSAGKKWRLKTDKQRLMNSSKGWGWKRDLLSLPGGGRGEEGSGARTAHHQL